AQVRGDFARSTALSDEGLAIARAAGYAFGEARALLGLGITAEWQGDLDLAARRYAAAERLMAACGEWSRLPHWTVLPIANLADVALLQGDYAQAADLAEEAVRRWRTVPYPWGIAQALGTAAAAAAERGDLERAARRHDEALTLWLDGDDGRGIAGALAGIAAIAAKRRQPETAAQLLGAAWGVAGRLGIRFLAHHVYAERLLAATRLALAPRRFAAAWAAGHESSVTDAVALAWRVLAAAAETPQAAGPADPALTRRECDVLRLLVDGLPDREIAAALFISARTVQTHVAGLLAKFDARSRTELAAVAVRRGIV
ncbi:MAG TPA: response regulator transcription factor, partial [Thermomicrobiales bacterium]|nr:response regulator transcription factor [Thermomicrobiales bacterium]